MEYHPAYCDSGAYHIYTPVVRDGEDTELVHVDDVRVDFLKTAQYWMREGDGYQFMAQRFHESRFSGLTATIMTKTDVTEHAPRVGCPVDESPDNEFNRYQHDPVALWEVVDSVMKALKPKWGFC